MSMRYKVYFDSFFVLLRTRGWESVPTMPEYAGPVVSLLVKCLTPMLLRCKLEDDLAKGIVPCDSVDLFIAHVLDTCETAQPYCEAFDRIMVEQSAATGITTTTQGISDSSAAGVSSNTERAATVARKQSSHRNGNGHTSGGQVVQRNDSKHTANRSNSASMSMSMSRSFSMDITAPDTPLPTAASASKPSPTATPTAANATATPSGSNRWKRSYTRQNNSNNNGQYQRRRSYRGMRKFVPDCLLPRCDGKHLLIHCPLATDEEKKTLLAQRRTPTAAGAAARASAVKEEKAEKEDENATTPASKAKADGKVESTESVVVKNEEQEKITTDSTATTTTTAESAPVAPMSNNESTSASTSTATASQPSTVSASANGNKTGPEEKQRKKLNVNAIEFEPVTPAANRDGVASASNVAQTENVEELKKQARRTMDAAAQSVDNSNSENGVNDNANRATAQEESVPAAGIEA